MTTAPSHPISAQRVRLSVKKPSIRCEDKIEKLFLKFTLPGDDPFTAFLNKYNLDASEVKAYKEIIPKLVEFEKVRFLTQFHVLICRASLRNLGTCPDGLVCRIKENLA